MHEWRVLFLNTPLIIFDKIFQYSEFHTQEKKKHNKTLWKNKIKQGKCKSHDSKSFSDIV